MGATNTSSRYGWLAQWLHWLIAALIITQFVLGQLAEAAAEENLPARQLALLANHKSVGMTVLLLAIIRIGWRIRSTIPELPVSMPRWQTRISNFTHWLLYLLIFVLPMSGWLMSSASAYTVSWFNLVQLPDLVGPSEPLKDALLDLHHLLATTLFLVASLHLLAALKHHFFDRDDVLIRMLSRPSGGAFALVLAGGIWLASSSSPGAGPSSAPDPEAAADTDKSTAITVAGSLTRPTSIASWQIDYAASHIQFSAEQAGASFEGKWPHWQGDIRFSANALRASSAIVEVDVTSVDTGDSERDDTLLSAGWFAASAFPTARFVADAFSATGAETFAAAGTLTIKHASTPVQFLFSVQQDANGKRRTLDGTARLDRLELQLGTGEWADPTWVGQFVDVSVHVEAQAQVPTQP